MFDLASTTEHTAELRLHRFGRLAFVLMAALLVYWASLGVEASKANVIVEQDAAYYCAIAERLADGEGYNSLADRRGPAPPRDWPQPVESNSAWPAFLGAAAWVTGEARWTGTWMNLSAVALLVVLWPIGLWRILRVPGWVAVLCTAPVVLHREAFQAGLLPLTDGVSLLTNAVFIGLLMAGRIPWAVPVLVVAIALRHQNAALLLPMVWCLMPPTSAVGRWRWLLIPGAIAAAIAYSYFQAGGGQAEIWTGFWQAMDPTVRDSVWRGIRFLSLPVLVGVPVWIRSERLRPLLLLGLGHLLVLATHSDPNDSRPYFFSQRQGLPLHLVASGITMVVLARGRGAVLWISLAAALAAAADHMLRPYKITAQRTEVTQRPELQRALNHLRSSPLPGDPVVLCHDADVLSWRLGLRTVHTRAFQPTEAPDATVANLRQRGVTHALLLWSPNPIVLGRNTWMDGFLEVLGPEGQILAEYIAPAVDGERLKSGFILLQLQP